MGSDENCSPAFIPVWDVSVTSVQGAEAWVQTAGAVGPSSLGICLGGDESA